MHELHSADDSGMDWLLRLHVELIINSIHGGYYCRHVGVVTREVQHRVLVLFKNSSEILHNDPILLVQLKFTEFESLVRSNGIDCIAVFERESQEIIS
jgi:hypothetical protein